MFAHAAAVTSVQVTPDTQHAPVSVDGGTQGFGVQEVAFSITEPPTT